MTKERATLTVFYDGGCIVCSREMEKYKRRDKGGVMTLVDIAAPDFDPTLYGRDQKELMAKLHVRDEAGNFHTGVDAFSRIWEALPQPELHLLAALVNLPGISLLARGSYWMFARTRKFLPKRSSACNDDSCNLH